MIILTRALPPSRFCRSKWTTSKNFGTLKPVLHLVTSISKVSPSAYLLLEKEFLKFGKFLFYLLLITICIDYNDWGRQVTYWSMDEPILMELM